MSDRVARQVCAALIRAGGLFVPHEERAEWMAEWHAELASCHEAASARDALRLVRRCLGAPIDGASVTWLRSSDGLSFDALADAARASTRTPWRAAAAVVGATVSLAIVGTLLGWLGEEWGRGGLSRSTDLVVLHNRWEAGRGSNFFPFSSPEFDALRTHAVTLSQVGAYSQSATRWTSETGESKTALAARASANLFDVVGMRMVRGRAFTAADESPEALRCVVLSSEFWRRSLHADRRVLGSTVLVAGEERVVVGIAEDPPGILPRIDLWVPLVRDPANPGAPNARSLGLVGRLASGVPALRAQHEVATLLAGVPIPGGADPPESFDRIAVDEWGARRRERDLLRVTVLLAAFLVLALIARCAVEFMTTEVRAERLARVVTILLPSLVVAMCVVRLARHSATSWLDAPPPSAGSILCALVAAAAALLMDAARGALSETRVLRDRRTAAWLGGALVLAAGVLLFRASAPALRATGLPSDEITLLPLRFEARDPLRVAEVSGKVLGRVANLPGIEGVGVGSASPFGRAAGSVSVALAERIEAGPPELSQVQLQEADYHFVDAHFFEALSIPVRGKRMLAPGEIIINEALARDLDIADTALGRALRIPARERVFTVVGIAPDLVLRDPTAPATAEVFFALGGTDGSSVPVPRWGTLWVRTARPRDGATDEAIRGTLAELGPELATSAAWSVRDARWSQWTKRANQTALGLLALGLGLSLSLLARGRSCPATASLV